MRNELLYAHPFGCAAGGYRGFHFHLFQKNSLPIGQAVFAYNINVTDIDR